MLEIQRGVGSAGVGFARDTRPFSGAESHSVEVFAGREPIIEIKKLINGHFSDIAVFADDDVMRAEPFDAVEIGLGSLWVGKTSQAEGR